MINDILCVLVGLGISELVGYCLMKRQKCLVVGHKWGNWESHYPRISTLQQTRRCRRCGFAVLRTIREG